MRSGILREEWDNHAEVKAIMLQHIFPVIISLLKQDDNMKFLAETVYINTFLNCNLLALTTNHIKDQVMGPQN